MAKYGKKNVDQVEAVNLYQAVILFDNTLNNKEIVERRKYH